MEERDILVTAWPFAEQSQETLHRFSLDARNTQCVQTRTATAAMRLHMMCCRVDGKMLDIEWRQIEEVNAGSLQRSTTTLEIMTPRGAREHVQGNTVAFVSFFGLSSLGGSFVHCLQRPKEKELPSTHWSPWRHVVSSHVTTSVLTITTARRLLMSQIPAYQRNSILSFNSLHRALITDSWYLGNVQCLHVVNDGVVEGGIEISKQFWRLFLNVDGGNFFKSCTSRVGAILY